MVYNESLINNATNVLEIAEGIGTAVSSVYLLGYLTIFSFFIIFLILSYRYDTKQVLLVDFFLCSIISIMLFGVGLLPANFIVAPVVGLMFTIIFYYLTG